LIFWRLLFIIAGRLEKIKAQMAELANRVDIRKGKKYLKSGIEKEFLK